MVKILLVDPDPISLKNLNFNLRSEGFETMLFNSPTEALAAAEVFRPEIIVSDINLPEMNGFSFLKEIKKNENLSKVPFIFLSAYADSSNKLTAFEVGADEFITKPYVFKDLIVRLNLQLKLRRDPTYKDDENAAGELKNIPMRILLEKFRGQRKTGLLRIIHNGESSFIGFKDGEILFAKAINRIGKQAIFYLFTLQVGKFRFEENEVFPNRNVLDNFMSLMSMAEKCAEIAAKSLYRLNQMDRIVFVDTDLISQLSSSTDIKDYNLAKLLTTCHHISKVISYSEFGILEILKMLTIYIRQKRLVLEPIQKNMVVS